MISNFLSRFFKNNHQTIVTQFEPPANLTASELGFLYDGKQGRLELLAGIYQLKTKKIIEIKRNYANKTELTILRYPSSELKNYEDMLLRFFFHTSKTVFLQDYFNKLDFGLLGAYFNHSVMRNLQQKNLITVEGDIENLPYPEYMDAISNDPSRLNNELIKALKPRKLTDNGRQLIAMIEGFKHYIETAELEKIKFHASGDLQEYIEKLTPYAIALDQMERWRMINIPFAQTIDEKYIDETSLNSIKGVDNYFAEFSRLARQIDAYKIEYSV